MTDRQAAKARILVMAGCIISYLVTVERSEMGRWQSLACEV
jgi:hypothetical protein